MNNFSLTKDVTMVLSDASSLLEHGPTHDPLASKPEQVAFGRPLGAEAEPMPQGLLQMVWMPLAVDAPASPVVPNALCIRSAVDPEMYAYMSERRVRLSTYEHTCICVYVLYIHTYTCVTVYVHTCMRLCIYANTCVYVCAYTCVY